MKRFDEYWPKPKPIPKEWVRWVDAMRQEYGLRETAAVDAAWKAVDDAQRALNSRIEDDVALLVRAGIPMSRLFLEHHPDGERRLLVDGRLVQRYTMTLNVDGEELRW